MKKRRFSDQVSRSTGKVVLRVWNRKGKLVREFRLSNVITNGFRTEEHYLLAGDSIATRKIDRVAFGTNPVAEDPSDTAITNPSVVNVAEYLLPGGGALTTGVLLEGTLPYEQGNGVTFAEVGLLHADGTLATRKAFSPTLKSSMFRWTVSWPISWE